MLSGNLMKQIYDLPDDGAFWKSSTKDTVISVLKKMLSHGMTEDEAFSVVSDMWIAVSAEHGN